MKLRKHQAEMLEVCTRIRNGGPVRDIYVLVTPGGGKSALPAIAGGVLIPGFAEALCWVAPRTALQRQGEENFLDPRFRNLISHNLTIRASTNEPNPCRCENGFITTYQAVGVDRGTLVEEFRRRRYILVTDEYHHAEEDSQWHAALAELVSLAVVRIYMTGTFERGNGKKIAFTPYRTVSSDLQYEISRPAVGESPTQAVIRYTRADALAEQAILPLRFEFFDGRVQWKTAATGRHEAVLSDVKKGKASAAIYTALNTDYAEDLLSRGFAHWANHKRRVPGASLLVVTSGIEQARRALEWLKRSWALAEIATSHDSSAAHQAINNFRRGALDVLATIAMAYEGMDCPSVSHIICLTHIRSTPWIEQMLARAVRIDPDAGPYETQEAHIFAPDDALMRAVCARIEAEQAPVVRKKKVTEEEQLGLFGDGGCADEITPLGGEIIGARGFAIGRRPRGFAPPLPMTPSDIEADLRQKIEAHVRGYSQANYYKPQRINGEIRKVFGKSRPEMDRRELAACLSHVKRAYPASGPAVTCSESKPRQYPRLFPTKPVPWRPNR
ncbi:MAG: helicase-related protein [Pseudomonadota bacterium]